MDDIEEYDEVSNQNTDRFDSIRLLAHDPCYSLVVSPALCFYLKIVKKRKLQAEEKTKQSGLSLPPNFNLAAPPMATKPSAAQRIGVTRQQR
jgi:hypothetical protein